MKYYEAKKIGKSQKSLITGFSDYSAFSNVPPFILQMVSLWSIILTFMVLIVSLCSFDKQMFVDYSDKIRKEFGIEVSKKSDNIGVDDNDETSLLQNVLLAAGFSASSNLIAVVTNDFNVEFFIRTPVSFSGTDTGLTAKDREYLDKFGSVFFNLPGWNVGVYSIGNEWVEHDKQMMLNFERGSAVARYLHAVCGLSLERLVVWSSSYEHFAMIFPDINGKRQKKLVFLSLIKMKKKAKNA